MHFDKEQVQEKTCSYDWQVGEDGWRFVKCFEFCQPGAFRQQNGDFGVNNPSYSSFRICFLIISYCVVYFSIGLFKDTLVIKNHPILGFIQPLDFQHKSFSTKPQNYIFNIYSHYVNAQMSVNNDPFRVSAHTCIVIVLDVVILSQGYRLSVKDPKLFLCFNIQNSHTRWTV